MVRGWGGGWAMYGGGGKEELWRWWVEGRRKNGKRNRKGKKEKINVFLNVKNGFKI